MKRIIISLIVIALLFSGVSVRTVQGAGSAGEAAASQAKIHNEVQNQVAALQAGEMVTVIVTLTDQTALDSRPAAPASRATRAEQRFSLLSDLRRQAESSQEGLSRLLGQRQAEGKAAKVTNFWIFNGMAVTATREVIEEIAARPEVFAITPNRVIPAPAADSVKTASATDASALNLSVINAPALWDKGFRGQGIVIASLDTGVSIDHPALAQAWRGGSNSWFDPYGQHASPTDLNGHGTWTMGVMVGQSAEGTVIGLAPEAKWISAKIFDDQNSATLEAIHLAFQWVLDPDGNPATDDAPDVVNNSWSFQMPGCYLDFQPDLEALRAAGILPIFAAGNTGPDTSTSVSPSNNPAAFAVGAVDNVDQINLTSARGSSSCGEEAATYPDMVAPGVDILSTGLYGSYTRSTGTSLASPHVAGALALLLDAFPGLDPAEQQEVLIAATHDLGKAGPDNDYGFGRLDVLQAYNLLAAPDVTLQVRIYLPLSAHSFNGGLGAH